MATEGEKVGVGPLTGLELANAPAGEKVGEPTSGPDAKH